MNDLNSKVDALLHSMDDLHKKIDSLIISPENKPALQTITKSSNKKITLPELARKASLSNGQQRITAIVGYYEKVLDNQDVLVSDLQQGWKDGKFSGSYSAVYLHRALKEGLVRQKDKNVFDLTQTGEDFFSGLFEIKPQS
jgi:hypothetical protein